MFDRENEDDETEADPGTVGFAVGMIIGVVATAFIAFLLYSAAANVSPQQGTIAAAYQGNGHWEYVIKYDVPDHQGTFNATANCNAYSVGQNVTFGNQGNGNQILSPSYPGC